ncbi:hypothetical protein ACHHYP_06279 [Achlya hypogyna]|uniref:FYVE-type domain-containing protein n=1 Tax=Achlya hypogyna TaxID=1202772 RepID=A0A1V9YUR0_ACHHY|nr:hypothetical protein ACHHYP_06279 [Achlya hypogyna]
MAHCHVCSAALTYFRRKSACSLCTALVCSRCYLKVTTDPEIYPLATKNVRAKVCLSCVTKKKRAPKKPLARRATNLVDLAIESTPNSTPVFVAPVIMAPVMVKEPLPSHEALLAMEASGADTHEKMTALMERLLSVQHTTEHIMSTTMQLNSPVA